MPDHAANLKFIKAFGFFLAVFGSAFSNSFCGIGLGVYLGGLCLQAALSRPPYPWRPFPAWRLLLVLLACLLVSVAMSDYLLISLKGLGKYLQGFVLLYAGIDVIRSEKEKKAFVFAMTAGLFLAVSCGIYQGCFGVDYLRGHRVNPYLGNITRLTGTFKHPNDYGTYLVPGLVFTLALFLESLRKKNRVVSGLWFLLLAGLCYVLVCTLSRGAILSAFAALLFFSLFFKTRWLALAGGAAAFAALWFIPSPLGDRLHELKNLSVGDAPERMLLIKTSLRMIAENPVFGLGLNTYSDNYSRFKPPDYPAYMYSHNSYLQMAAEAGILGTALFFSYIGAVMARFRHHSGLLGPALLAGVFGILVNCLFESVLQSTQLRTLFWSLLGAAAALAVRR